MIVDYFGQEIHKGDLVAASVTSGRSSGAQRVGYLVKEPEAKKMLSIEVIPAPTASYERAVVNVNYSKSKVIKLPKEYALLV